MSRVESSDAERLMLRRTRCELTGISPANVLAAFDCVPPVNTQYSTGSQLGVQESTTGVGKKLKLSIHIHHLGIQGELTHIFFRSSQPRHSEDVRGQLQVSASLSLYR